MSKDSIRDNENEEISTQETRRKSNSCVKFLRENWFMLSTVFGVCLGFGIAFVVRHTQPGPVAITWISMPANLYLRMLQLTILPLIASNILVAVASLDFKKDGKIALIGILYIILINFCSALAGTLLALAIKPGSLELLNGGISNDTQLPIAPGLSASDIFADLFMNIFPDNIVSMTMFHHQTEYDTAKNETVSIPNKGGTNMIGVLFCSIAFGLATKFSGEIAKPFLDFMKALSAIVTKLMGVFLLVTPVAVCFMVAGSVAGRKDIRSDFIQLGFFILTVLSALGVHFLIIVIALFCSTRRNPFRLLKYSGDAFILAFATTSPALALPETYIGLDKYGVKEKVSRLVGPLAAALKGDGPAAFIAAAVIFVAQQAGVEVNIGQIVTTIVLVFSVSFAVPNIPSASIVLIVTVVSSIGVPSSGTGILFAMEWLLDRCRSGSGALAMMYLPATVEAIYDRLEHEKEDDEDGNYNVEEKSHRRLRPHGDKDVSDIV